MIPNTCTTRDKFVKIDSKNNRVSECTLKVRPSEDSYIFPEVKLANASANNNQQ